MIIKHFVWQIVKDTPRTRNLPASSLFQWLPIQGDFIKKFKWPERKNSSHGLGDPPAYLVIYQFIRQTYTLSKDSVWKI